MSVLMIEVKKAKKLKIQNKKININSILGRF